MGEISPSIPWPGRKGCFKLPVDSQTSSCILVLVDEDTDELECENPTELGVRGVAVSAGRYNNRQLNFFGTILQFAVSAGR